ncbi:MAG TPA: hypothetical protein VG753_00325 [Candidatus Paceibacterota bacterium]|nr:hypothetical protein [Candidatus Paceibacterota bacterium]
MSEKARTTAEKLLADSPHTLRHVLRAQDFTRDSILELFELAKLLEQCRQDKTPFPIMQGRTVHWYGGKKESSSRTKSSHFKAAQDLGGAFIDHSVANTTEDKKGESIEDIVLTISTIDPEGIIVMRHEEEDAIWGAALVSKVPLINAGSGKEHHPTQALLDALTVFLTIGRLDDFSIAFVGDLLFGRTADSFAYLLTKFNNVKISLVSRDHLRMKRALRYYLELHRTKKNLQVNETADLEWLIGQVDFVYQTRAQKERSENPAEHRDSPPYILDRKLVSRMKEGARIMHPWPRNEELPRELDSLPQQLYINQMYYGRMLRRALLAKICHDNPV